MVKLKFGLSIAILLLAAGAFAAPQLVRAAARNHGDSLLIKRVQQEQGMNLPRRGMTMSQVSKTWGAPLRKLSPRGGGSPQQPVINRWDYAKFIVYFQHNYVIHSVLNTPAGNNTDPSAAH
ncbi:MAG: hypothetical protein EPN74_06560 [Rhodanobacter sp.]|nr:MAG: hypothetical protein EPN74_06560 [Rhodanobacter sp.]